MYRWEYDFFGLTPANKAGIHEEIFTLCHHGGGFTHNDVYHMPTYLRRFYLKQLVDLKKEEKQQYKKASNKQTNPRIRQK